MNLLVQLLPGSIEEALRTLPAEWRVDESAPAGRVSPRGALAGTVGAWLDFYGIVRAIEDPAHRCGPIRQESSREGRHPEAAGPPFPIRALRYEAHEAMAVHQMNQILSRLGAEHGLTAALVLHRVGEVPVGEASLLVRILSPHREEALRATARFIDELKQWVPIWKHPVPA